MNLPEESCPCSEGMPVGCGAGPRRPGRGQNRVRTFAVVWASVRGEKGGQQRITHAAACQISGRVQSLSQDVVGSSGHAPRLAGLANRRQVGCMTAGVGDSGLNNSRLAAMPRSHRRPVRAASCNMFSARPAMR